MSSTEKPLDPREQELLAYLEDLQANNPAEYELLVKQMQEQAIAQGGKAAAAVQQQGEQVTPLPGFVAKTRSATNQGNKVFINVCQSEHVDKPAPVSNGENVEEVQMRIPMSLGPPREDLDKSGEVCTVYDVVFHPEAVDGALKEAEFRSFVMQLTLYQIQQKYKDELSEDMTFPKVRGNYKGIAPLPQFMRKKGTPPPPPPGSAEAEAAAVAAKEGEDTATGGNPKPLVEEMAPPAVESLPAPSYSVEPRQLNATDTATASPDARPDGLSLKAHLPLVTDASTIEVGVHAEVIEIVVPSMYALTVQLPQVVKQPPLSVRFETGRRILSIVLRVDNASIDDGIRRDEGSAQGGASKGSESTAAGEGFSADWAARLEREREARMNARRRRLAGNQQLKRQEAADEAAAEHEGEPAAAGENSEAAETGAAAATEEAAAEATAVVPTGPPPPPPYMGMSNSIMFELED